VHETLRTFLTDAEACPIPIPLHDGHNHILSICLDILSSERDESSEEGKTLKRYASENWVEHISKASVASLGLVRAFLESDGFKWWISYKAFEITLRGDGSLHFTPEEDVDKIYRSIHVKENAQGLATVWPPWSGAPGPPDVKTAP